ncbi:methyltransferase dimerization domain-containing protein [Spongiactinospora sp. TRM90649]|uniref:methyltransferase n=1 Tax=Spongiactinospora sp. TRM90649 TaxID=3031114 RepID=UPI0023F9E8D8|nr:methyltransferase dimerization domain-containing protein [Spongiactinospora sp. TRM90649]MDF5758964.1 methyltransferase dimerization domain-containing protein [Spongiactinospora sp. TRM90649]
MPSQSESETSAATSGIDTIATVATGYMAAKQLFTAAEAGLFAALAEGPATAAQIAARTGLPERTTRILADTMTSLDLLTRADGRYENAAATARHLAGAGDDVDLRPWLAFLDRISYSHWLRFGETARTDGPMPLDLGGDRMGAFMSGVMTYNALHAKVLAQTYDFTRHSKVLDFGGLSASFLIEALRSAPGLTGVFFSGGDLAEFARKALAEAGGQAEVVAGDVLDGPVPDGFDLVLLEHVAHRYSPEENRRILERARTAATPDATLLLLDYFLDDEPRQRALDALHAGEYLVIDGTVVYPREEVTGWLRDAGWEPVETLTLAGSPRVIVARAR